MSLPGGLGSCMGDSGYTKGESIRSKAIRVAALAKKATVGLMAIDDANQMVENYQKKNAIQDQMVAIEEEQQQHLQNVYWPRELEFLEEHCTPQEIETAGEYGRRHSGRLMATVARSFAEETRKLERCSPRYCTTFNRKRLQDLYLAYSDAMGYAKILGRIMGFLDVQRKKDVNFERKLQALGLGKGLLRQAAQLYGQTISGLDALGDQLSNNLSQSLTLFGMADQRRQMASQRLDTIRDAERAGFGKQGTDPLDTAVNIEALGFEGLGVMRDPTANWFKSWSTTESFLNTEQPDFTFENDPVGDMMVAPGVPATIGAQDLMWGMSKERGNEGDVGNRDRVRMGQYTYHGYDGYPITVKMSDFEVDFADHMQPGEKGGMGGF